MKSKTDLSLVSIDDLLKEVGIRFDHFVFTGCQIRQKKQDGSGVVVSKRQWFGNNATCLGLMKQMEFLMCDAYFDEESLEDED